MELYRMVEKKDIPICHGEPMIPEFVYKEDGRIIVRYMCGMYHCNETGEVMVKTPAEKKEIKEALDLFRHMWKHAGEDP